MAKSIGGLTNTLTSATASATAAYLPVEQASTSYKMTLRELRKSFTDVINVADYGATGDGVTDDTSAIQSAIAAAVAAGGVLFFPAGTYLCTSATTTLTDISGTLLIFGDGIGKSYLIGPDDLTTKCFTLGTGASLLARDLSIGKWYSAAFADGNAVGTIDFDSVEVYDCLEAIGDDGAVRAADKLSVTRCDFHDMTRGGVYFRASQRVQTVNVANNDIYDISSASSAIAVLIGGTNAVTLTVSSVDTSANTVTFSAAHLLQTGDVVQFATTGSLPGGISADTDYYVTVVNSTTISVSAGAVGDTVDLTSSGSGNTATTYFTSDGITIHGNSIRNVYSSLNTADVHGIICYGTNVTITGNKIKRIWTAGTPTDCEGIYTKVHHGVISGNVLIDAGGHEAMISCKGAERDAWTTPRGHSLIVANNNLMLTNASEWDGLGIEITEVSDFVVTGNYLENVSTAFAIDGCDGATISGNRVLNGRGTILNCYNSSNATFSGNVINGWITTGTAYGFQIRALDNNIENISITGNVVSGGVKGTAAYFFAILNDADNYTAMNIVIHSNICEGNANNAFLCNADAAEIKVSYFGNIVTGCTGIEFNGTSPTTYGNNVFGATIKPTIVVLPTTSAGLPSGALWNNGGVVTIA